MISQQAPTAGSGSPADLVKRIRAGERSAEDELVSRYHRGVSVIIQRMVRDPSLTEDICQDTFRLALEKVRRGDVREAEKFSAFICSLARNLAIEHFRRLSRRETTEDVEAIRPLRDPAPDQLSMLLQRERVNAVRQVLKEMKLARDREILYRFYIVEEDKERICADLGLGSLHFNRVLHRARERFKELCQQIVRK